jgi:hypothetical protein
MDYRVGPPDQAPHHHRGIAEKADVKPTEVANFRKAEEKYRDNQIA